MTHGDAFAYGRQAGLAEAIDFLGFCFLDANKTVDKDFIYSCLEELRRRGGHEMDEAMTWYQESKQKKVP